MSGKTNGDSPNRNKTLIAAGMRIDGKVDFTGTLVVRGEIRGEVSSADGAAGVLVVDPSGSATGKLAVPRIIVRGRVAGPMDSSQSIEIHAGGSAVGDVRYRVLAVQAGGVVDGLLTHAAAAASERAPSGAAAAANAKATANDDALAALVSVPVADQPRSGGRGMVVGVIALIAAVPLVFWLAQRPPAPQAVAGSEPMAVAAPSATPGREVTEAPPARPAADAVPERPTTAAPGARDRPAPAPSAGGNNPGAPRATPTATAAAIAVAGTANPAPTRADARGDEASTERPEPDVAQAVAFSGINPARPAGLLFVVTRAPAVVYKKKTDDRSRGTRLAFGNNRNTSIRVSPEEVVRVAEGTAIDLYYQGVRVPAQTVDSGAWMRFVPLPPPAPREDEDVARPATVGPAEPAEQSPGGTDEVRSADRAL